jgi:hypothetical protein
MTGFVAFAAVVVAGALLKSGIRWYFRRKD